MKKLFNYALLAAALLVGVNVNADEVTIDGEQTYSDLKGAIESAEGERTIIVKKDLTGSATIVVANGQSIVLDLGENHTVATDAKYLFGISHGSVTVKGTKSTIKCTKGDENCYTVGIIGTNDPNAENYSVFTLEEGVNMINETCYALANLNKETWSSESGTTGHATKDPYGMVVNIAGYVSSAFGISINGGYQTKTGNITVINISGTIVSTNGAAIYAAGYAIWNITGTIIGSDCALYAKSGQLNIYGDAVVRTTCTGDYVQPTENGNGYTGGDGCAIVLDSNKGYAGDMQLNISGNATIEAGKGYAIDELKTNATSSKTDAVVISGGNISGAINTTAEVKQDIIDNETITGGNFNTDITDYLGTNGIVTPVTNDDGTTSYVIATKDPEIPWKNDITTAEDGDYVKVPTGANQALTEDVKAEYLVQEGTATITVPEDVTLTVGEIVMSKDARIIVKPGAALIVEGDKGIVANNMENIVIETRPEKAGVLLLDPDVTSNKTPKATVRFYSKAFGKSEMVQLFGCPMVQVDKVEISNPAYKAQFDVWRKNAWDLIGVIGLDGLDYSKFNLPFGLYCITSGNPATDMLYYDFTGSILGNTQPATLNLGNGYISIANSWVGNMDTKAIIEKLIEMAKEHDDLQASIYVYEQDGTTLTWNGRSLVELGKDIKPMEAIMILNEGSGFNSDLLSYKDLVFDPATKTNVPGAPAEKAWDKASIRIAAENQVSDRAVIVEADQFSSNFENGYDTKKYMNEEVCVYVNADQKYDIFATDDVNNTFVGFNCKNAGKYTISFENVTGNFALVDTKTNARIEMSEGNTYEFLAEAGEDAYRFQIVEAAKAPTNTPATKAAVKATKALINDQIVINNGERFFNMLGTDVK